MSSGKSNRFARRGVPANFLELPLHLAVVAWAAILMGMSGHDLRTFYMLRKHLDALPDAGSLNIDANGMTSVDVAWVVVGAITFVWAMFAMCLGGAQFKGRKGSYTGKGTALWAPTALAYLILSGIWLGVTAAYTNYASTRSYSLSPGPGLQEPLSEPMRMLVFEIAQSFRQGYAQPLFIPDSLSQLGITTSTLGPWGNATSLAEVNRLAGKYEDTLFYRAELICCWFALATVFTTFVVHTALPIALKTLGWTRMDKNEREQEMRGVIRLLQDKEEDPNYPSYPY